MLQSQYLYSKANEIKPCYMQVNPIYINNQNYKEILLTRPNFKKSSRTKKSVSFNPKVSVTEVESWKKYNSDVTKETEFYQFKNEYLDNLPFRPKKYHKKKRIQDDCNYVVF